MLVHNSMSIKNFLFDILKFFFSLLSQFSCSKCICSIYSATHECINIYIVIFVDFFRCCNFCFVRSSFFHSVVPFSSTLAILCFCSYNCNWIYSYVVYNNIIYSCMVYVMTTMIIDFWSELSLLGFPVACLMSTY